MKYIPITIIMGLLFLACSGEDTAGGGSRTGNVTGKIFDSKGESAKEAKVLLYRRTRNTEELKSKPVAVDSTITDNDGNYKLNVSEAGAYTMISEGSGEKGFVDSLTFAANDAVTIDDTLSLPGSIDCSVDKTLEVKDMRGVLVHLIGTEYYQNLNANGSFRFDDVPAGKYTLMLWSVTEEKVSPSFSSVVVASGQENKCVDGVSLVYTGVPIPTIKSIAYDTLTGMVSLGWDSVQYEHLQSYVVERNVGNADDVSGWRKIGSATTNSFQDVIFENKGGESSADTLVKKKHYRLRIKNAYEEVGQSYGYKSVSVVSPRILYPYFKLDPEYSVKRGETFSLSLQAKVFYGVDAFYVKKEDGVFKKLKDAEFSIQPKEWAEKYEIKVVDKKGNELSAKTVITQRPTMEEFSLGEWKLQSHFIKEKLYVIAMKTVNKKQMLALFAEENGAWKNVGDYLSEELAGRIGTIDFEGHYSGNISRIHVRNNVAYRTFIDTAGKHYLQRSSDLKSWESAVLPDRADQTEFSVYPYQYSFLAGVKNGDVCVNLYKDIKKPHQLGAYNASVHIEEWCSSDLKIWNKQDNDLLIEETGLAFNESISILGLTYIRGRNGWLFKRSTGGYSFNYFMIGEGANRHQVERKNFTFTEKEVFGVFSFSDPDLSSVSHVVIKQKTLEKGRTLEEESQGLADMPLIFEFEEGSRLAYKKMQLATYSNYLYVFEKNGKIYRFKIK